MSGASQETIPATEGPSKVVNADVERPSKRLVTVERVVPGDDRGDTDLGCADASDPITGTTAGVERPSKRLVAVERVAPGGNGVAVAAPGSGGSDQRGGDDLDHPQLVLPRVEEAPGPLPGDGAAESVPGTRAELGATAPRAGPEAEAVGEDGPGRDMTFKRPDHVSAQRHEEISALYRKAIERAVSGTGD